jgi:hypothetical protein
VTPFPGLAIVGCGATKLAEPAPAADLYTGPYFRSCLATALALVPRERVFILSAWYGLLGPDERIRPYDVTISEPGAISAGQLAEQAAERGLLGIPVVALCSRRYAALLREVWPDAATPLAHLGIGQQRHELAMMRAG